MKIIVIGAGGTIGAAVVRALQPGHDVIEVGHKSGEARVDLGSKESIERLFAALAPFDAVVSTAGLARFGALDELSDQDYALALDNKLMGQVNLLRVGRAHIRDQGSFTLTGGMLAREPMPGSAAISMANAGLHGFVRAAALELPRGLRLNAVSPVFVKETMVAMGMDSTHGMPAATVAKAYLESVDGRRNGEILDVRDFA